MCVRVIDFERSLIAERTSAGREAARARGVRFGPKPSLSSTQVARVPELYNAGKPIAEISKLFGVHRETIYRALDEHSSKHA